MWPPVSLLLLPSSIFFTSTYRIRGWKHCTSVVPQREAGWMWCMHQLHVVVTLLTLHIVAAKVSWTQCCKFYDCYNKWEEFFPPQHNHMLLPYVHYGIRPSSLGYMPTAKAAGMRGILSTNIITRYAVTISPLSHEHVMALCHVCITYKVD